MPLILNNSLDNRSNRPDNHKYLKQLSDGTYRPYLSVSEANAERPVAYRAIGLTYRIGSTISNSVEYWYQFGTADTDLVLKSGSNFYYDSNFFTGEITANSPLRISPTGVTAGEYTNPKLTVNTQGQVVDIEDGTGGGTITSFVTATDVEITDATKGFVDYSPNGKKWRSLRNDDGTWSNVDVYSIDPTVFLANFTGTAGTNFNDYTPDMGVAHSQLAPITLDGSGHGVFSANTVTQIIIDSKIPPSRKYSMRIQTMSSLTNNYFQFTILRNIDNTKYVYVVFFYVDATHMGINILTENQGVPIAIGTQFVATYPMTAHVDYLGGNRVQAYVNTNTGYVSGTVPDMTGLYDYADVACLLGGTLDWARLDYADFVNPVVFYDTFTGSAGNWTGHTPDVGTGTVTATDSTFGPLTLDGSGNGVFDPAKVTRLIPNGALTTNRLVTALIVSFPANGSIFQTTVLHNSDNSIYRYVKVARVDATHVFFGISAESGVDLAFSASVAITYPLALQVIFDGTTITASLNNSNILTTTNIGSGLLQYVDFAAVNGATLTSIKLENI